MPQLPDQYTMTHGIWVPPNVTLVPGYSPDQDNQEPPKRSRLVYPLPDSWRPYAEDGSPFPSPPDVQALCRAGWRWIGNDWQVIGEGMDLNGPGEDLSDDDDEDWLIRDPSDLWDDIQYVADDRYSDDHQVREFASLWGPLWLCRNPAHGQCHWSWKGAVQQHSPCLWRHEEEVQTFVQLAKYILAVVDAALDILEGGVIAPEHLAEMGWHKKDRALPPIVQRQKLLQIINQPFCAIGGPRLQLTWDEGNPPRLEWSRGFGVVHTLWMEFAQKLGGRKNFIRCQGCQRPYMVTRQPQPRRRNYCRKCGREDRYKAAKREWWRNNRGKSR
jgi:hypothetical protein